MIEHDEYIKIESADSSGPGVRIDRATQYEVVQDMTAPAEARFEIGDDGTWEALADAIKIGRRFRVSINGTSLMAGRLLMRGLSLQARTGATVQLTVRTRLADALFASCEPFALKKTTLKDAILRAYATLGMTEADFLFNADASRDILTGKGGASSGASAVDAMQEEDARVHPPETVFAFADRHLRRFDLRHWDAPDGRVVVGKPNDQQSPLYRVQALRAQRGNNVLSARRTEDYEQVPDQLLVYGQGGKLTARRTEAAEHMVAGSFKRVKRDEYGDVVSVEVGASILDPTLSSLDALLHRRAVVVDESIRTASLAEARARREMAMRSLQRDSWDLSLRGWTFPVGTRLVPYALDTVAEVCIDVASPVAAPYYVWRVAQTGSAGEGHSTVLTVAAQGIWRT
jgi:prophage tail gpP-like protein